MADTRNNGFIPKPALDALTTVMYPIGFLSVTAAMYPQAMFAMLITAAKMSDNKALLAGVLFASEFGKVGVVYYFARHSFAAIPGWLDTLCRQPKIALAQLVGWRSKEAYPLTHFDQNAGTAWAKKAAFMLFALAMNYAAFAIFGGLSSLAFVNPDPSKLDAAKILAQLNWAWPRWLWEKDGVMYHLSVVCSLVGNLLSARNITYGFTQVFNPNGFMRANVQAMLGVKSAGRQEGRGQADDPEVTEGLLSGRDSEEPVPTFTEFDVIANGPATENVTVMTQCMSVLVLSLIGATLVGFYDFMPIGVPAAAALDEYLGGHVFRTLNPSLGQWGVFGEGNVTGILGYLFLSILGVASATSTARYLGKGLTHLGQGVKELWRQFNGRSLAKISVLTVILLASSVLCGLPVVFQNQDVGMYDVPMNALGIVASANAEFVPFIAIFINIARVVNWVYEKVLCCGCADVSQDRGTASQVDSEGSFRGVSTSPSV